MDQPLHIRLLGEFRLLAGDLPITDLPGERQQSLLAYLLLHRHAPQSRQHLAFTLWPDSSESQARANLRNLLFTLRQALPDPDRFLVADTLSLQWRPDAPFTLDVADFQQAVDQARQAGAASQARRCLEQAIAVYSGDLLPGNYDDWIASIREELRQTYLESLDQLIRLLEEEGDYAAAMHQTQRRLRQDTLYEPAYVQLMRLHALSGDRAGVQRIYQQCEATLERELGVEPSPTTQVAYEQYLRMPGQEPALPAAAPLRRTATTPPGPRQALELSMPLASLVGRDRELAELAQLLADPKCRLLTITGPGGMGKTHLALQAARAHQPVFPDGAIFVPLAPVADVDLLLPTIANALGFIFSRPIDPQQQLLEYLREKALLLVLDNFEHLLEGIELLIAILTHAPHSKLLVTSRERLNIKDEWVYDLHGLPVPEEEEQTWMGNDAVQLFVDNAHKADQGFALTEANRAAIARICRLVEGMPLALILAAAWVRVLSPAEIASEIERNLDFLASSLRDVPERHRSLRAVFDHSWVLLPAPEQPVLCRLAVFEDGFTREAAEVVAGADLRLLCALVDKSWLRYQRAGRYDMHEQVRHYALDRLQMADGELASTHDGHSRYFLAWLARQDPIIHGADPASAVAAITADLNNVRAAWSWALSRGWHAEIEAAMNALYEFFGMRNWFRQGAARFYQVIDALHAADQEQALTADGRRCLGHAYTVYSFMLIRQGRIEEADAPLQASLDLLDPLGPSVALVNALYVRGLWLHYRGAYPEAERRLQACIEVAQQLDDAITVATSYLVLGQNAYLAGDHAGAHQQTEQALAIAKAAGTTWMMARILCWLSLTALTLGRLDEAEQHGLACLESTYESGDRWIRGQSLLYLGLVANRRGDHAGTQQLVEEGMAEWKAIDQLTGRLHQINTVAGLTAKLGADAMAGRIYRESFRLAMAVPYPPFALDALIGLAELSVRAGDLAQAAGWLLTLERHPDLRPASRDRVTALRASLDGRVLSSPVMAEAAPVVPPSLETIQAELL